MRLCYDEREWSTHTAAVSTSSKSIFELRVHAAQIPARSQTPVEDMKLFLLPILRRAPASLLKGAPERGSISTFTRPHMLARLSSVSFFAATVGIISVLFVALVRALDDPFIAIIVCALIGVTAAPYIFGHPARRTHP